MRGFYSTYDRKLLSERQAHQYSATVAQKSAIGVTSCKLSSSFKIIERNTKSTHLKFLKNIETTIT